VLLAEIKAFTNQFLAQKFRLKELPAEWLINRGEAAPYILSSHA
jgi:hypothetical protein